MLTMHRALSRRAGFTLIELAIALVLMSLVGGAIVQLLLRQQRFYNSTTDLIQTRQQIRQAAAMLPSDLRGISSIGGGIYALSRPAVEVRPGVGSPVVWGNTRGRGSPVPPGPPPGATLTHWARPPPVGDS